MAGGSLATELPKTIPTVLTALKKELQCSICLSPFLNPQSTPCHHQFCRECILHSLQLKRKCPLCVESVTPRCLTGNERLARLGVAVTDLISAYEQELDTTLSQIPANHGRDYACDPIPNLSQVFPAPQKSQSIPDDAAASSSSPAPTPARRAPSPPPTRSSRSKRSRTTPAPASTETTTPTRVSNSRKGRGSSTSLRSSTISSLNEAAQSSNAAESSNVLSTAATSSNGLSEAAQPSAPPPTDRSSSPVQAAAPSSPAPAAAPSSPVPAAAPSSPFKSTRSSAPIDAALFSDPPPLFSSPVRPRRHLGGPPSSDRAGHLVMNAGEVMGVGSSQPDASQDLFFTTRPMATVLPPPPPALSASPTSTATNVELTASGPAPPLETDESAAVSSCDAQSALMPVVSSSPSPCHKPPITEAGLANDQLRDLLDYVSSVSALVEEDRSYFEHLLTYCHHEIKSIGASDSPPKVIFAPNQDETLMADVLGNATVARAMHGRVTHLICSSEGMRTTRSIDYLTALLTGAWIVSSEWVDACRRSAAVLPEDDFEIVGDETSTSGVPRRARRFRARYGQGLLTNVTVVLHGEFQSPTSADLQMLVEAGGGVLLSANGGVSPPVRDDVRVVHLCSQALPLNDERPAQLVRPSWLLDSIANFELLPTDNYIVAPTRPRASASPPPAGPVPVLDTLDLNAANDDVDTLPGTPLL